jgi:hypothetical protein
MFVWAYHLPHRRVVHLDDLQRRYGGLEVWGRKSQLRKRRKGAECRVQGFKVKDSGRRTRVSGTEGAVPGYLQKEKQQKRAKFISVAQPNMRENNYPTASLYVLFHSQLLHPRRPYTSKSVPTPQVLNLHSQACYSL